MPEAAASLSFELISSEPVDSGGSPLWIDETVDLFASLDGGALLMTLTNSALAAEARALGLSLMVLLSVFGCLYLEETTLSSISLSTGTYLETDGAPGRYTKTHASLGLASGLLASMNCSPASKENSLLGSSAVYGCAATNVRELIDFDYCYF
eukprot:XP_001704702.1 Hypothetical protein GL50803_31897 [Giardia lamblia ATCC 50803]